MYQNSKSILLPQNRFFNTVLSAALQVFFSLTLKQKKKFVPPPWCPFSYVRKRISLNTRSKRSMMRRTVMDLVKTWQSLNYKSWVKLCQSHDYLRFIFYEQDVILSCLHSWETPRSSSSQKTEKTLLLQGTLNIIMLYPQFISKVKDMQSPTRHSCSF